MTEAERQLGAAIAALSRITVDRCEGSEELGLAVLDPLRNAFAEMLRSRDMMYGGWPAIEVRHITVTDGLNGSAAVQ